MESLYINNHPDLIYYPLIDFNASTGILEISGESYMEETFKFYEPVFIWLNEFKELSVDVVLNMRLTYFNTSSSRFILDMIELLNSLKTSSRNVTINWYYKRKDRDMLSEIFDFEEETGALINKYEVD